MEALDAAEILRRAQSKTLYTCFISQAVSMVVLFGYGLSLLELSRPVMLFAVLFGGLAAWIAGLLVVYRYEYASFPAALYAAILGVIIANLWPGFGQGTELALSILIILLGALALFFGFIFALAAADEMGVDFLGKVAPVLAVEILLISQFLWHTA